MRRAGGRAEKRRYAALSENQSTSGKRCLGLWSKESPATARCNSWIRGGMGTMDEFAAVGLLWEFWGKRGRRGGLPLQARPQAPTLRDQSIPLVPTYIALRHCAQITLCANLGSIGTGNRGVNAGDSGWPRGTPQDKRTQHTLKAPP